VSVAALRRDLAEARDDLRALREASEARLRAARDLRPVERKDKEQILTARTVEQKLEALLRAEEPRLVRWLVREWKGQRADITDEELLDAIRTGDLPLQTIWHFQDRYTDFVNTKMVESWSAAAGVSSEMWQRGLRRAGVQHRFDFLGNRIEEWTSQHSAELVTHMLDQQRQALRNVIRYHTAVEPLAERSLVRLLRPLVGLTPRQANQVRALREELASQGVRARRIDEQVARLALRNQRIRAQTIARTELAMAYNNAAQLTVKDVVDAGGFESAPEKVWRTQKDERVCPICGPLHEQRTWLDGAFENGSTLPPAHPRCRCVVLYEMPTPLGGTS